MGEVINIFRDKKKEEKKKDTNLWEMVENMHKENEKRMIEERKKDNESVTSRYRLKGKKPF